MPLTDLQIKAAKPQPKTQKLFDGGGMYLEVTPNGGKWWRLKYRIDGKEKSLSFGTYPEVSLGKARERREAARKQIADGIDPSENRKAQKAAKGEAEANSFEVVAREWLEKSQSKWVDGHAQKIRRGLERDVFPYLGAKAIAEIKPKAILDCLNRIIEQRQAVETAHRIMQNCGQIMRYAVATGRAERDVVADLRGALPSPQVKHMAAITEPNKVGELLRAIDGYSGTLATQCALKLAPLVFQRPAQIRMIEWAELDLDSATWETPSEKMKRKKTDKRDGSAHITPLSIQAIEILRTMHPLTGHNKYVFAGVRDPSRPMSDNTLNAALRRLGYTSDDMTAHGFRAMARTILDEVLGVDVAIIEQQLAHAVKDPLGRAYNRTQHLPQRRAMMQQWADYLDDLKRVSEVVPLSVNF